MRHITLRLALLTLLITSAMSAGAQAYDGDFDWKIYAGYLNYGGKSGGEFGVDYGVSEYVSVNMTLRGVDSDPDEYGEKNFLNGCDAIMGVNCHFQSICHLPSNVDFYAGPNFSIRRYVGAMAGARYNFGEVVGAYVQGYYNIAKVLKLKNEDDKDTPMSKKWGVSVGLTFNIF